MEKEYLIYSLYFTEKPEVLYYFAKDNDSYNEKDLVIAEDPNGEMNIASIHSKYSYPISVLPAEIEEIKLIERKFEPKTDFKEFITERNKFMKISSSDLNADSFIYNLNLNDVHDLEFEYHRADAHFSSTEMNYMHQTPYFVRFLEITGHPSAYTQLFETLEISQYDVPYYNSIMASIYTLLANLLEEGKYYQRDLFSALELFEDAARLNHASAYTALGYLYLENNEIKDDVTAFDYFTTAAALGDINGIYKLGDMYRYGLGTTKNLRMAGDLYNRSYNSDYDEHYSFYNIIPSIYIRSGDVFFYGIEEEINFNKAFYLYITAYRELYHSDNRVRNRKNKIKYLEDKISICISKIEESRLL